MPEPTLPYGKSFDDNIDSLFHEIVLAEKWGRPSLLLAVHKSKIGQDKAEQALEVRLKAEGLQVVRFVFNDARSDISLMLREHAAPPRAVYFISNVDWGGGNDGREAYRGLNMHRELFVEEGIKAVFWLTVNEAANMPRFAPDFWAFRHRVVEFVSQRAAGKVNLPAGILAWDTEGLRADPFGGPEAGIAAREELLRKLPDTMEAISARVELHASLAHMHWDMANLDKAQAELDAGSKLCADLALPELKAGLKNAQGILLYERGQHAAALERFGEGLRYRSSSRVLLINSSAANCMLGRIEEALSAGKKAVRANAAEADTWRRLGYIHNAAGRTDEGITCMARAIELAPRAPEHRVSLAVLYSIVDRPEDARQQLERAGGLGEAESVTLQEIVREAAIGDPAKARDLLARAVAAGKLQRHVLRRDVDMGLLFEPKELEGILK